MVARMKADNTRVYVGLGSNSGDASVAIARAVDGLAAMAGLAVEGVSPEYRTEPQDYADQPWFRNRVVRLAAAPSWQPVALMRALLGLEAALGRVRSPDPALRFGPRAIDIDMLLFGDTVLDDPVCTLPHPRLHRRAFWLVPLLDLSPAIAVAGTPARELLSRLDWRLEGDKIFQ